MTNSETAEPNVPSMAPASGIPAAELEQLSAEIVGALKTVYDPEIPADIYEIGLIYRVDIDDDRNVEIDMTLTAPGCPVAGEMPAMGRKCGRIGCRGWTGQGQYGF